MKIYKFNEKSFSFIVPCFNEEKNLVFTLKEIYKVVKKCKIYDYEIIVIDDASQDSTLSVAKKIQKKYQYIKVVSNNINLGFGGSYKKGVRMSIKKFVILIPGDNAHPADGIVPIINLAGKSDIVIPYVIGRGTRSIFRMSLSKIFTLFVNLIFSLNIPYYNGLVLHKTSIINSVVIKTNSFAYQAEGLVRLLKKGHSFLPVPVVIKERDEGKSSAFKIKNIINVFKAIIGLKLEFLFAEFKIFVDKFYKFFC